MDYSYYNQLFDKSEIRGVPPVFNAYKTNLQFQPWQATGVSAPDIIRLEDRTAYEDVVLTPPTEAEQRAQSQFQAAVALQTINEAVVTGGKELSIATAFRSWLSTRGGTQIMSVPPTEVTAEKANELHEQMKKLVKSARPEDLNPESNSPIFKQFVSLLDQKTFIDLSLAGKKDTEISFSRYSQTGGFVSGAFGQLWDFGPIWDRITKGVNAEPVPQTTSDKIIGEDMHAALTAVDPDFNPEAFFENTIAVDPVIKESLLRDGITADTIAYARNEFEARVQIGLKLNSTRYQQRMALYNPTWLENLKSLGLSLANVMGNIPDTTPFIVGEGILTALLVTPAAPVGAGGLAALSLGGGLKGLRAYRAAKRVQRLKDVTSTVWSLTAGGIPTYGRSWGIVRSALINGISAAGVNTSLNYISQSHNIANANALHYMNDEMSSAMNTEELADSALYGFAFGAGLSVLGSTAGTLIGKAAGRMDTPLDMSYRNAKKTFGSVFGARGGDAHPISKAIVRAELDGRTPTLEETNAEIRAKGASVDTAGDVASRSADAGPENPLMRRFAGEDINTYVQRMAEGQVVQSATEVLDAMSGGRRYSTLTAEEQFQVGLESIDPLNKIIDAEYKTVFLTPQRKAQHEAMRLELQREINKAGKAISKETKDAIRKSVKEGKAYTRMGIQTPNALDSVADAKAKARQNAIEITNRARGTEPVRNTDTSEAGKAAEKTAEELEAELREEAELTAERVLNSAEHQNRNIRRLTKKLLGGEPSVTMKRLAIAKSKARKLTRQQRRKILAVLKNKSAFLSEAVGNSAASRAFYDRIQKLVDDQHITDDDMRLVLAATVNLNFNKKPIQTQIKPGVATGYSIANDDISIGNLVFMDENADIKRAMIVVHEIGHAYEMYATGPSLMKLRELFANKEALDATARELLDTAPFNMSYITGNTQELYAQGFARMLFDEVALTAMLNAAREDRGLLAYLLQEMVTDVLAAIIHVSNTLKANKIINDSTLYGIIKESIEQIEQNSAPVLRRVDAVNRIQNGIARVRQSYDEYAKKTPATERLTLDEWLNKKSNTQELANKINRALVEDVPNAERNQVLVDFGLSKEEAAVLIRAAIYNKVLVDTFINTRSSGYRLTDVSTAAEVRLFIDKLVENQAITRRYFSNVFSNYTTALQVNGLRMPKDIPTENMGGHIPNQLEELENYVRGLPISQLEVQQPYLDPTLGVLSDDINLAMHYMLGQEGLQTTGQSSATQLLGAPLGKPAKVLTGAEIVQAYKDTNNRWADVLDTLHKIVVEDLTNERTRLETENKGRTAPLDVEVRLYDKPMRAFFKSSLEAITSTQWGSVRFIAIKSQDIPGNLTPGSALKGWDVADTTVPKDWVMVHEMAHAVTATKIDNYFNEFYRKFYNDIQFRKDFRQLTGKKHLDEIASLVNNPNVDPAMRELLDTYLEAAKASENDWKLMARSTNVKGADAIVQRGGEYGFGNVYEFIAQAFNEPKMQERLKSLPSRKRGQTIYNRLLTAMKKLLGLDANQETMFDEVMRLTEEIAITPTQEFAGTRRTVGELVTAAVQKKAIFGFPVKPGIADIVKHTAIKDKLSGAELRRKPRFADPNEIETIEMYTFKLDLPDSKFTIKVDDKTKKVLVTFDAAGKQKYDRFEINFIRETGEWKIPTFSSGMSINSTWSKYLKESLLFGAPAKELDQITTKAEISEFVLKYSKNILDWDLQTRLNEYKKFGYSIEISKPPELLGAPIERQVPTTSPAFKTWFGSSKVVDEVGQPLIVYHGTSKDTIFTKFRIGKRGAWFTTDPASASQYAMQNDSQKTVLEWDAAKGRLVGRETNTASRVIPVYLKIERPAKLTTEELEGFKFAKNYAKYQADLFEKYKRAGHDGVDMGDGVWVTFEPTQIKSIYNSGAFNPSDPNILGAPMERPTPPVTKEGAINRIGAVKRSVIANKKVTKDLLIDRLQQELNLSAGIVKMLRSKSDRYDVFTALAENIKNDTFEVDADGIRVSLSVLESELTPNELKSINDSIPIAEETVAIPTESRVAIVNDMQALRTAVDKEITQGSQVGKRLQAAMRSITNAVNTNSLNRLAVAVWELENRLRKTQGKDTNYYSQLKKEAAFGETITAMETMVATTKQILNDNNITIETPTRQVWTGETEVRITKWKPVEDGENVPVIVETSKPIIRRNGVVVSYGEVVVQDVQKRNPLTNKMVRLSHELEAAMHSTVEDDLLQALASIPMANDMLEAAKTDGANLKATQARTAIIMNTAGERLRNVPQPEAKPKTEADVRAEVAKSAKEQQEHLDIEEATNSTDSPNTNKNIAASEPDNAVGDVTAVVTDDVNPLTPHLPIGVAETVASNSNTTNKFTSTAATTASKTIEVTNEGFKNKRHGMVGNKFYSSLAEMEGILASLPTSMDWLNTIVKPLRRLYTLGREKEAVDFFVKAMQLAGVESVVVKTPKSNQVVKVFRLNENKWTYGGIASTETVPSTAPATKGTAPNGQSVPVTNKEVDNLPPRETEQVKITQEEKLMLALNESKEALRDGGMDVSDISILLKRFWRTAKDKLKKKTQYITDEFQSLLATISEVNASIMEINRNQLQDADAVNKFWTVVDRLMAAEEASLRTVANYRMRAMADIYQEAADAVSEKTVKFVPPVHASQIQFKRTRINGESFMRIVWNVDKDKLKLIRTIQSDAKDVPPAPSPTAVSVPVESRPSLPNAPNTGRVDVDPKDAPVPESVKLDEESALDNIMKRFNDNPAQILRANTWVMTFFGGSERRNRSWWRVFMSKWKNFNQLWSGQGKTQRNLHSGLRTMAHMFDPTHTRQNELVSKGSPAPITFAQAEHEARWAILGIFNAYGDLYRLAKENRLTVDQQNNLLKYYAISYMKEVPMNAAELKKIIGVDKVDNLLAAMNKLKQEESRLNQMILDLKKETGWNPIKDKDGNFITGEQYFSLTFDGTKFRNLEATDGEARIMAIMAEARKESKLKSERLDTNTLVVMGILNIEDPNNLFYGERNFLVTVNPNLTQETLNILRKKDGYRRHSKKSLSNKLIDDIKKARTEEARKYFILETENEIEVIPMPETINDLAARDLDNYRKTVEGDKSMYADGWRKFLGGRTLVEREIAELVDFKLYRGDYAMRNMSRIKTGSRPVLNAKDDKFFRVQNITQEEIIAHPELLDVINLNRRQVAIDLAQHNLFDLLAQREIDRMSGFQGLRPWRFLAKMEERFNKEIDSDTKLTRAEKDALKENVRDGMTRLLYQYADWNGTLPVIRSAGDDVARAARGLIALRAMIWGLRSLGEPLREIVLKLPTKQGIYVPVDALRLLGKLLKVWDRNNPAHKAGLLDVAYALEDAHLGNAKFEENLNRSELDADDLGYGGILRQTSAAVRGSSSTLAKAGDVLTGLGQASLLLGGSRELMNFARSLGKARYLRTVHGIIKKTNIDKLIQLRQDPANRKIMEDYLEASATSAADERRLVRKFKALCRQAGIDPNAALLASKFGMLEPEYLQAMRWAINELKVPDGQVNFNALRELLHNLRTMDNPPVDPEVFDKAIKAYQFGLETSIRIGTAHHTYGLNKALGPLMLTEYGKLLNQLTSWLRSWEDGFSAALPVMGSISALGSLLILGGSMDVMANLITEWVQGRDVSDMLKEMEDNPEDYIMRVATQMPVAGVQQGIVTNAIKNIVTLSGGTVQHNQSILDGLSLGEGPAIKSLESIMRDVGMGGSMIVEGAKERDTVKMLAGGLRASQLYSPFINSPIAMPVRSTEELGLLQEAHGTQMLLDHLQKKPRPYSGKRMGTPKELPQPSAAQPRNYALEEDLFRRRQAERPDIRPVQPTPPMDKTSGVSSLLGSLLEGYNSIPQ